jgi:hypothetical protein
MIHQARDSPPCNSYAAAPLLKPSSTLKWEVPATTVWGLACITFFIFSHNLGTITTRIGAKHGFCCKSQQIKHPGLQFFATQDWRHTLLYRLAALSPPKKITTC